MQQIHELTATIEGEIDMDRKKFDDLLQRVKQERERSARLLDEAKQIRFGLAMLREGIEIQRRRREQRCMARQQTRS